MDTLDEIILSWKIKYGEKRYRTSWQRYIPSGNRITLLCHLVKTLKESFAYTMESFTDDVKNKIVSACVNEGMYNFTKLESWKKAVRDDLKFVLLRFFNSNPNIKFLEDEQANEIQARLNFEKEQSGKIREETAKSKDEDITLSIINKDDGQFE